jgi:hypothetical protein
MFPWDGHNTSKIEHNLPERQKTDMDDVSYDVCDPVRCLRLQDALGAATEHGTKKPM